MGNNKNIEGWEEEFEDMFKIISFTAETEELYQKGLILQSAWEIIGAGIKKDIKQFVRNLLQAQRSNLAKEIEGLKIKDDEAESFWDAEECEGYNQAISDIINLINSSK